MSLRVTFGSKNGEYFLQKYGLRAYISLCVPNSDSNGQFDRKPLVLSKVGVDIFPHIQSKVGLEVFPSGYALKGAGHIGIDGDQIMQTAARIAFDKSRDPRFPEIPFEVLTPRGSAQAIWMEVKSIEKATPKAPGFY